MKYTALFLLFYIFNLLNVVKAQSDSTQKSSPNTVFVSLNMFNDNDPFSNQKGYNSRNRDDHGLTFVFKNEAGFETSIFKKFRSTFTFTNFIGLYTKDMGGLSTIMKEDADFDYFSYILKVHPDWDNIYLYNQSAITKITETISMQNNGKHLNWGLSLKLNELNGGIKQTGTDIQHWFHKFLQVRNFYHNPFTDSTALKGEKLTYYTFGINAGVNKLLELSPSTYLKATLAGGCNLNSTSNYGIKQISPYGHLVVESKTNFFLFRIPNLFKLNYNLYYEPYETLAELYDPTKQGYQSFSFGLNFNGYKRSKQIKKWGINYDLTLFQLVAPIGTRKDLFLNYLPAPADKQSLTGFMNLKIACTIL